MTTVTERLHTLEEAAAILNISVKTLRAHVYLGRIRSVVIGGGKNRKHRRFTDKNIASFIAAQKVRETPACPSTSPKTPLITMPGSKSTVVAFTSLLKQKTKKMPN
ncbi:helix-turn-helix domain-containing protein [Rhizobium leguminosarum]|uniref:helix-turn-helix domain-containing protein n=1 Tax=Rhizobium leguminosarum TaxID=384 RepID=UPI001C9874C5|nr:helix-turn-helix domain-containing protein [Rhizobium leguminosarum]